VNTSVPLGGGTNCPLFLAQSIVGKRKTVQYIFGPDLIPVWYQAWQPPSSGGLALKLWQWPGELKKALGPPNPVFSAQNDSVNQDEEWPLSG
jgi:hypothetical protein